MRSKSRPDFVIVEHYIIENDVLLKLSLPVAKT